MASCKNNKTRINRYDSPESKDGLKWVVVQLNSVGEREKNVSLVIRSARQLLKNKEVNVFIPAVYQKVREESHMMFYMDGYIFVEYIKNLQYFRLQETTYFSSVLCNFSFKDGERKRNFSLLDDSELDKMRVGMKDLKISEFNEGDNVKITKGSFKNLQGKVSIVHDDGENIQIHVCLKSKQALMDFPSSYLVKVE